MIINHSPGQNVWSVQNTSNSFQSYPCRSVCLIYSPISGVYSRYKRLFPRYRLIEWVKIFLISFYQQWFLSYTPEIREVHTWRSQNELNVRKKQVHLACFIQSPSPLLTSFVLCTAVSRLQVDLQAAAGRNHRKVNYDSRCYEWNHPQEFVITTDLALYSCTQHNRMTTQSQNF